MKKAQIVIVSPALSDANNGNWQTARRWAAHLSNVYRTRIVKTWNGQSPEDLADAAMLALHARRSSDSIAAWHAQHGSQGLVLALTGTDLYRDIQTDTTAISSMNLADRLIVLQELGATQIPQNLQHKVVTIFQSTRTRKTVLKTAQHLNAIAVGHLRPEKSPQTLCEAAQILKQEAPIRIRLVGAGLDENLSQLAIKTQAACGQFTWLGSQNHLKTRGLIQRSHVLVHASQMEGGAHVVMEAVCSGTPVLASRIDGNVGMLGTDYLGYFDWGDAKALSQLLLRCQQEPNFLTRLQSQCEARRFLFAPEREKTLLLQSMTTVLKDKNES